MHQAIGSLGALERPRFDQRLHDLLDEERIAAGALVHDGGKAADARMAAEQVGEQLAHRLFAERHEREPLNDGDCIHAARYSGRKLTSTRLRRAGGRLDDLAR